MWGQDLSDATRRLLLSGLLEAAVRMARLERSWPPHRRHGTRAKPRRRVKPEPTSIHQAVRRANAGTLARLTSIDLTRHPHYRREMAKAIGVERIMRASPHDSFNQGARHA
jgi:hypothetical protein